MSRAMVTYVSRSEGLLRLLLPTHLRFCALLTLITTDGLLLTKVWAFSVSYFRNQYAIIDQKATFGQGEDGHPHLGPEQGCAPSPLPPPTGHS